MAGLVKVITGEMFSGKSQELARLIIEGLTNEMEVQVFYPESASRGSNRDIEHRLPTWHSQLNLYPVPKGNASWLLSMTRRSADIVAIDEAQFFSDEIVQVVKTLRREGKLVLIGGLDKDYQENPFGRMGDLMCIANDVVKFHAFCAHCQCQDAFVSYRLTEEEGQVVIGESNYVPLCEDCYVMAMQAQGVRLFVD